MKTIAKNIGKSKRIANLDHRFLGKILNKYYMRYNNYLGYFSFTHRQNPALEYFENLSNQIDCHLELLNDQQTNILTTNNIVKSVLRNVQNNNDLRKRTIIHNNFELSNLQNHYKEFNIKQVSKNANSIQQNKNLIKNFTEEINNIKNILNLDLKNLDYSQFLEKNLLIEKIKEEISKSNEEHNVGIHFSDNDYIKFTETFISEAIKTQEFNNIFKKQILRKELVSSDDIRDKGVINNIIVNSLKEIMTQGSFNNDILDRVQYVTKGSKEEPQNRELILSIFKKVFINNRENLLKANYSYKNHISNLKKASKNIKHIKSFTEEISNVNNILNLDVKRIDYNKFLQQNLLIERIKEEILKSNEKHISNIRFSDNDYIKLAETFISEAVKTQDFNSIFKRQILKNELGSSNDIKDKSVINDIIINSLKETIEQESFNSNFSYKILSLANEFKEAPQNIDILLSIFKKVFIDNGESLLKSDYSYKNYINNLNNESKNRKLIKRFAREINNVSNILNLDVKKLDYNKLLEKDLLIERIKEEILKSNEEHISKIHFSDNDYIKLTETFISEAIKTQEFNSIFKGYILKNRLFSSENLKDKDAINSIVVSSLKETVEQQSFNKNISYKIQSLTNEFKEAPQNIDILLSIIKRIFIDNGESLLKSYYSYKNYINNLNIEGKNRKLIKSYKEEINNVNNILDLGIKKLDYSKLLEKNLLIERIKEEILKSNEKHTSNIHFSDQDYIKLTETFISETIKTPEFNKIFKRQISKSELTSRNDLKDKELIDSIVVKSLKETMGLETFNRNISYKLQSVTNEFKETPEHINRVFSIFKKVFINNKENLFKANYSAKDHISNLEIERKNKKLIKSFKEEINNIDNRLNLDVKNLEHNEFIDKNVLVEKIKEEILKNNEEYVYNTHFSHNDYVKLADTFISEAVKTQDFNNIFRKRVIRNKLSNRNELYNINSDIMNSIKETIVLEAFNKNISYRVKSLTKEFNEGSNNINMILSALKKVFISNTEELLKVTYNNKNDINNLETISLTKQLFKTNNLSDINKGLKKQLYFPYTRNALRKVNTNNIENQVKNRSIFKTLLNKYKHNYLMNSNVSKINIKKDSSYKEILDELLLDKSLESKHYSNSLILQELKSLENEIDVNLSQINKRISNFDKVVNKSDNDSSITNKIIDIDSIKDLKAKKLINSLPKIENLSYEDNDYRTYNENVFSQIETNNLSKSAKTKLLFLNKLFTGRETIKGTNFVPIANRNVYKQIDYLYKNITRNKIVSLKNEHNLISFYDNRFIQRRNYHNHLGDTLNELLSINNLRVNNTKSSLHKEEILKNLLKADFLPKNQSKISNKVKNQLVLESIFKKNIGVTNRESILNTYVNKVNRQYKPLDIIGIIKEQNLARRFNIEKTTYLKNSNISDVYINKEFNTLMQETQIKEFIQLLDKRVTAQRRRSFITKNEEVMINNLALENTYNSYSKRVHKNQSQIKGLLNRKIQKYHIYNNKLISSKDNIEIHEIIHKNIDFINRNLYKYTNTIARDYRSNLLSNKYISLQTHREIKRSFAETALRKFENNILKGDGTRAYLELFDFRSFSKDAKSINKNILKIERPSDKEIINKLNILKVHNKRNESISSFNNFSYKRNTNIEKGLGYKGSDIDEGMFSQYDRQRFAAVDMAYKRNYNLDSDLIEKISQDQTKLKKVVEEEIQKVKSQSRQEVNIVSITERVYKNIERKLKSERQRRGMI